MGEICERCDEGITHAPHRARGRFPKIALASMGPYTPGEPCCPPGVPGALWTPARATPRPRWVRQIIGLGVDGWNFDGGGPSASKAQARMTRESRPGGAFQVPLLLFQGSMPEAIPERFPENAPHAPLAPLAPRLSPAPAASGTPRQQPGKAGSRNQRVQGVACGVLWRVFRKVRGKRRPGAQSPRFAPEARTSGKVPEKRATRATRATPSYEASGPGCSRSRSPCQQRAPRVPLAGAKPRSASLMPMAFLVMGRSPLSSAHLR